MTEARGLFTLSAACALLAGLAYLTIDQAWVISLNQGAKADQSGWLVELIRYCHGILPRRFIGLSVLLGYGVWAGAKSRRACFLGAALAIGTFATNQATWLLKELTQRTRPGIAMDQVQALVGISHPEASFPSAHTSTCAAAMIGLLLLFWWLPRARWLLLIPIPVFAYARVAGGVHYPSDVIASISLTTLLYGFLFWKAVQRLLKVRHHGLVRALVGVPALYLVFLCWK